MRCCLIIVVLCWYLMPWFEPSPSDLLLSCGSRLFYLSYLILDSVSNWISQQQSERFVRRILVKWCCFFEPIWQIPCQAYCLIRLNMILFSYNKPFLFGILGSVFEIEIARCPAGAFARHQHGLIGFVSNGNKQYSFCIETVKFIGNDVILLCACIRFSGWS